MPRSLDRAALAALAAIGVGLAFRLRTAALPAEILTSRYLADDYFYYLAVAHGLAGGHGSSADGGLTTTNGYQPLFLWLLTALFSLGLSKIAVLHAGLALQALASAAASLLAFRTLDALHAPWAGAAAATLLSLNLFFALPTLTGFEMALALAALFAAALAWQRGRSPLIVGLLCGVAVLARVDCLVFAVALAAITIARRQTRDLPALVAGIAIVAGPWLLWNWIAFGSPLPDSGVIKAHYRGLAEAGRALITAGLTLPRLLIPGRIVDWLNGAAPWTIPVMALAILIAIARGAAMKEHRALGLTAFGLLLAYAFLIGAGEPGALVRYLYPVWAIAVILIARSAPAPVVMLVLAAHAADLTMYARWERSAPLQFTYVGVSHVLAPAAIDRLPPGARIAAFDSGALNYFAPRPVLNLDGLANHDIVQLRRTCTSPYPECLRTYLKSKQIAFLAGGTGFGWTAAVPDWSIWNRVYESPPLADGSRLVILELP